MKLFVDLDGVLADFMGKLKEHYPDSTSWMPDDVLWPRVESIPMFWELLDWTVGGKHLWDMIKKYNPTVLSSPSRDPRSITGKNTWIDEYLGRDIERILVKARFKKDYAAHNHILIDDLEKNIIAWRVGGGIGILHKNAISTLVELHQHLNEK